MNPLEPMSDDALALLRDAESFDPPGGAEDRVLERLRSELPPVLPAPKPASPSPAPTPRPLHLGGPLSILTLLIGIGIGWVLHAQLGEPRVELRTVEVEVPARPEPKVEAPPPPPPPIEPVAPVKKPRVVVTPPAPVKDTSASDLDLARERELIEQARNALVRGEVKAANDALAQHAARFPKGRLAEERDSLWVQSLIRAGDFALARTRAAAFRANYPNSLLLPAVEAALKTIP